MVFLDKCKGKSIPINTSATQVGILPGDNYTGTFIPKPKKNEATDIFREH